MTKEQVIKLRDLLEKGMPNDSPFSLVKRIKDDNLAGFSRWPKENRINLGAYLIKHKKATFKNYWIVTCQWRIDDYFIVVYPENRTPSLLEIGKLENGFLEWRYKPVKRDGKNQERRIYFQSEYGKLEVCLKYPSGVNDLSDFVFNLFEVASLREQADNCPNDK
jgi:hypothetical protein